MKTVVSFYPWNCRSFLKTLQGWKWKVNRHQGIRLPRWLSTNSVEFRTIYWSLACKVLSLFAKYLNTWLFFLVSGRRHSTPWLRSRNGRYLVEAPPYELLEVREKMQGLDRKPEVSCTAARKNCLTGKSCSFRCRFNAVLVVGFRSCIEHRIDLPAVTGLVHDHDTLCYSLDSVAFIIVFITIWPLIQRVMPSHQ